MASGPWNFRLGTISAIVGTSESARRLEQRNYGLGVRAYGPAQRADAVRAADVVILACKHGTLNDALDATVQAALRGRTLVSVVGGVPVARIREFLLKPGADRPQGLVLRAITNIAARRRAAVTLIARDEAATPQQTECLAAVEWLFSRVGEVRHLPEVQMDAASALGASATAFFARLIEAAAGGTTFFDDSIPLNPDMLEPKDALWIAAQAAKGAAELIANEPVEPGDLVSAVATKGGSTAAGLQRMQERGVAEGLEDAMIECMRSTKGLANAASRT